MKGRFTHRAISRWPLSVLAFSAGSVSLFLVVVPTVADAHEVQYDWERQPGTRYNVTADTMRAGANPRLTVELGGFSDRASRVRFKMPEGMAMNPLAATRCSQADFWNQNEEIEKKERARCSRPRR